MQLRQLCGSRLRELRARTDLKSSVTILSPVDYQPSEVITRVKESLRWVPLAVAALLAVQFLEIATTVHHESLTWDEGDHMYAGYCMCKNGDYGLNLSRAE